MRWEDERYVRVYTRDTVDWLRLSWDAQALLVQLLRKADRHGEIALGREGLEGVAILLGHRGLWASRIRPAIEELLADGCLVTRCHQESPVALVFRNFVAAQETRSSDAQRKRDQRERDSVRAQKQANVTRCHQESPTVTPAVPAVPSRAVPSQEVEVEVTTTSTSPAATSPPDAGGNHDAEASPEAVRDYERILAERGRRGLSREPMPSWWGRWYAQKAEKYGRGEVQPFGEFEGGGPVVLAHWDYVRDKSFAKHGWRLAVFRAGGVCDWRLERAWGCYLDQEARAREREEGDAALRRRLDELRQLEAEARRAEVTT